MTAQNLPTSTASRTGGVPVSVWLTGQVTSRLQRAGHYTPESIAHPAKMLPAIAAQAIQVYSRPGQIVLDPMCGIGTTLAEAARHNRTGLGVEYEARWAAMARDNLSLAITQGAPGGGGIWCADARDLPPDLLAAYAGRVSFVLTSPPYGKANHGQVGVQGRTGHVGAVQKWDHRYGTDRANLGSRSGRIQLAGFTEILQGLRPLLAPGARIAVTARPYRQHGALVDLPSQVLDAGRAAGLVAVERVVALIAKYDHDPLDGEHLIGRPSFFQLHYVRRARAKGIPLQVIAFEDLIVFALAPSSTGGSRERQRGGVRRGRGGKGGW